ncbi:MAG: NADH-quinone oxidoreductase subunit NuoE [Desulfatiglandales bacterium]|jgi:NADH:ubiquinone oxidoreductase subunit E
MSHAAIDLDQVRAILQRHDREKWGLIPVLQEIQEAFGYVPRETIVPVAETLRIYPSQVQGVLTFYAGLSTEPKGKYVVRVCRGTACHVKGGRSILRFLKRELGLEEGETSPDYQFTLETVACLGACFLAPTMMVNKTYYGRLSPPKVSSILKQYGKKE